MLCDGAKDSLSVWFQFSLFEKKKERNKNQVGAQRVLCSLFGELLEVLGLGGGFTRTPW